MLTCHVAWGSHSCFSPGVLLLAGWDSEGLQVEGGR